jgi:succinate dehydrogenase/fumarate reductase cytochrome b subunit
MLADLFSTKIAYADATGTINNFIGKVDTIIINPLIYLLFALAVVYFLYGIFEFLMNQANEEKKTSGKSHMVWGVVGITIMLGVWTIMGMVLSTLGINYIHTDTGNVDKLQSP